MALLRAEAEKLSNNMIEAGVVEEIIDKEDLFAVLPFEPVWGKAHVYNRENAVSEADFLDPNDAVNEEASTFTEVTTKLRILIGDVDVDKFLEGTMSDITDQKATQIAQKAKGLARKFRRTLVTGDSSTLGSKEFDGVKKLVTGGQTIYADGAGTAGAAITLAALDQLLDLVPYGADAIFMRSGTIRAIRGILRTTGGGTSAAEIMLPNFGRPMLTHNGVPILVNDFLPVNETVGATTTNTSVYAARLNEVDGLHGIYSANSPAGIVVEDIGTVQNKDATRTRLKWYVGLALKSTKSLARLAGVTNI